MEGAAAGKRLCLFLCLSGEIAGLSVRYISFSTSSTLSIFQSMNGLSILASTLPSSANFCKWLFLPLFSAMYPFFGSCRNAGFC